MFAGHSTTLIFLMTENMELSQWLTPEAFSA
jgi:hypothetical protein